MKATQIRYLFKNHPAMDGASVSVRGWARTIRGSGDIGFIELNDGSFFRNCQIVIERGRLSNYDEIRAQIAGAALRVSGTVSVTPQAAQPFEIKATEVSVEGSCAPDYPLQKKRHSFEFLRENADLRPRTNTFGAVFRIRSEIAYALHKFFHSRNFVYVHTPIITGSDCEGAGAMFRVTAPDSGPAPDGSRPEFFGKKASLTVSGQLNVEAFALAYGRVYTFGPTFRAEKSNTARHAAEFWMVEPEMAFADVVDNMDMAEAMVKYVIRHVKKTCPDEIEFLNRFVDKNLVTRLENVSGNAFERITYTEAVRILEPHASSFEFPVGWGCDLQSEHERFLTEKVFNKPVFVTDYPKEIKAFYMRLNEDERTVAAMDLLVPSVGELVGGSQREERPDVLLSRIRETGLDERDYEWYLNLRRYGGAVHSGYGLGFARMVMYLTGISNIRDVIPYPRTFGSCDF